MKVRWPIEALVFFALAACGGKDATSPLVDAGFVTHGGDAGAPVDAGSGSGCVQPPSPERVQLNELAAVCAAATAGWENVLTEAGRANATLCGESVDDRDLPQLATSGLVGIALRLDCERSEMAHELAFMEDSVRLGRIEVHAERIEACPAARMGPLDDPYRGQASLIPECRVLEGVGAIGSPCGVHEECASFFCRPAGELTCSGVCAPRIPTGEACAPGRDRCEDGSDCADTTARGFRCLANAAVGERCGDGASCAQGAFCLRERCEAERGEGGACTPNGDECVTELVCVVASGAAEGTCRARAQEGEACGNARDGQPPCENRCLRCREVCKRRGVDGEPCTEQRDCVDDSYCDGAGACRPKPRRGEICRFSNDLPRGNCAYVDDHCSRASPADTTGVCTALPALCEPCAETGACAEGRCQLGDDGERYCFAQPEPPVTGAALGATCESHSECASSFCDPAGQRCAIECTSGCQGNRLDTYGYLIFFGVVVAARRRRQDPMSRR